MKTKAEHKIDYAKLWKGYNKEEQHILLCLAHAISPFSLDSVMALSGAPAVTVLSVMEDLKRKRIVAGQKEIGQGYYSLRDDSLLSFLDSKETSDVSERAIQHYVSSLPEGEQKSLLLGEMYLKMGKGLKGSAYIKQAADILYNSGQREKAVSYYDYLLKHYSEDNLTDKNVGDYLDCALRKNFATRYLTSIARMTPFMLKAEKIAQRFEKWDLLAQIKIALGQEFRASGNLEKGNACFDEVWKLAQRIKDPRTLRTINFAMHYDLQWKGRISEATRRYEEMIGSLEEFGDKEWTLRIGLLVGMYYHYSGRVARSKGMMDEIRAKAQSLNIGIIVLFADLCRVLCFIDMRRIPEARAALEQLCSFDEHTLGYHMLCNIHLCQAYLLCMNEEYEKSFEHHLKAGEYAATIGSRHHENTWVFEYLKILESKGFLDKTFNYGSEVERILDEENIHMKGAAFRYRALRNMERGQNDRSVLKDLYESEKMLAEAGAEIELARTRIVLGEYYLGLKDTKTGLPYITRAWTSLARINKDLFPKHLMSFIPRKFKIEVLADRIAEINKSLGTARDKHLFLTRVINVAMDFTMATRGAFFLYEPETEPEIAASRNLDLALLTRDKLDFIKQVVKDTAKQGQGIVLASTDKDSGNTGLPGESGITSLVCLPANLEERTYGYLYLDNPVRGSFAEDEDSPFLRMLCSQIAIALSSIYMYEEMRELKNRFEEEAIFYKREMGVESGMELIVGQSEAIKKVLGHVSQVSSTDSTVLILGETGVGKELVAKSVHGMSARKNGPFIPVNLAALPQELVASELFGHEKGAFTGANERKKGRFELADGGTIFLDEIGDLPFPVQTKLLRVLQEGTFERLGSSKQIRSDFRVVAATNKNLLDEVQKGAFRQDLFYRLNVFPIHVPPLRDRKEDVPLLVNYFVSQFSRKIGKMVRNIPEDEMKKLIRYNWPGNIRELQHIVERSIILLDSDKNIHFAVESDRRPEMTPAPELHSEIEKKPAQSNNTHASESTLENFERTHILEVLDRTHWRVSGPFGAAKILGLKPTTLFTRMKKLGIEKP